MSGVLAEFHLMTYADVGIDPCQAMDKDNREDFTFAKLSDIKLPVTFRMCVFRSRRNLTPT
jgi:hypothetical protein